MQLNVSLVRTLELANKGGLFEFNFQYGDAHNIQELAQMELLKGEWCGSLEYSPMVVYRITTNGEAALKKYKLEQLIASTSQCPAGQCKGAYATECYVKTDCITCGRPIIRG